MISTKSKAGLAKKGPRIKAGKPLESTTNMEADALTAAGVSKEEMPRTTEFESNTSLTVSGCLMPT
jgi:hypothetical protein